MPTVQTRTTAKVKLTGESLLSVDGRSQVVHMVHLEPLPHCTHTQSVRCP